MADRRQCIAGVLLRFVLVFVLSVDSAETVCSDGMFQCNNKECVSTYWRCDGNDACGDWSDESNCLCSTAQFSCLNGKCIRRDYYCDGVNDCNDNSDEINCDTTAALSSSSSTTTTTPTPTTTTTTTTRPPAAGPPTTASTTTSPSLVTPPGAPSILMSTLRSISSSSDAISGSTTVSQLPSTDDATPKLLAGLLSPNATMGLIVGIIVGVGGGLILVAVVIIVCLRCRTTKTIESPYDKPHLDGKPKTQTYQKLDAQPEPTYAEPNEGIENPDYRDVPSPGQDNANPTYSTIENLPKHDYEPITYNTRTGADSLPQSPSEPVKDTKVPDIETLSQNLPHEAQNSYVPGPVAVRPKATGVNTYDDLRNSATSTDPPHYETLETDAAPGHDYVEIIPEGHSTSA